MAVEPFFRKERRLKASGGMMSDEGFMVWEL
jgi:hypothetical protein